MSDYSQPTYSLPVPVPYKTSVGNQYPAYSQYSMSPPECDDAISSTSGVPSHGYTMSSGYSATSAGYPHHHHSGHQHYQHQHGGSASSYGAGSGSHGSADYDSSASASGLDFQEYMQDRFANSFDPIPLDRSMAVQAQTSGKLNAKQRELMDLQKQAQARLARTRERFAEGMRDAREVRGDLEWTQKKVSALNVKASRKHPQEYTRARARYPSPEM